MTEEKKTEIIKEAKKNTFTKSIMTIVILLYFIGGCVGTLLVMIAAYVDIKYYQKVDTGMFMAYAAYIGGPAATAIGFYAWKSKSENILKIFSSMFGGIPEDEGRLEALEKLADSMSRIG